MSASDAFETAILQLIYQNANFANVGDATGLRGSTTAGSLYLSLHTSDPGEAGNQATNETSYAAYARQAVARSSSGWTVSGSVASNAAAVVWPTPTSGSGTITHIGVGTALSGAGVLLFSSALTTPYAYNTSNSPQAAIGAITNAVD